MAPQPRAHVARHKIEARGLSAPLAGHHKFLSRDAGRAESSGPAAERPSSLLIAFRKFEDGRNLVRASGKRRAVATNVVLGFVGLDQERVEPALVGLDIEHEDEFPAHTLGWIECGGDGTIRLRTSSLRRSRVLPAGPSRPVICPSSVTP